MSSKVLAKTERLGLALQDNSLGAHWTTARAANYAFKTMQWVNAGTPNTNPDVQIDQINSTSQNGTHREAERFFIDASSGLPTISFTGICDKAEMAAFLVGAFQAVSEAASTPFKKTITAGGLTGPIDWNGGGGYLFTIALDQGASADDGVILQNALIQNLNIVWDLNARGQARMTNMSGSWVGNRLLYEQTLSGTWTNTPAVQSFFNKGDIWIPNYGGVNFTIDSVDYSSECIRRVEFQINNNITTNCKTTNGLPNQFDWAPEYKWIISLDYNAVTEKLLKDFKDGEVCTFSWSNDAGAAGTDGKWTFHTPATGPGGVGYLLSPPKVYNGEFTGINLEIGLFSYGGGTPLTVYFTDTLDWAF